MKYIKLSLIICIFIMLTGCSINNISLSRTGELNVLIFSKSELDYFSPLEKEIRKKLNIKLNFDYAIDEKNLKGDYWKEIKQSLDKKLSTGNYDLVMGLPSQYIDYLVENKKIISLEPFIKQDNMKISEYHQPTINISKKIGGGELYSLSPTFRTLFLILNEDIFNELDININKEVYTWEEIEEIAQKIHEQKDQVSYPIYPLSFGPSGKIGFFQDFLVLTKPKELMLTSNEQHTLYPEHSQWLEMYNLFVEMFKKYGIEDASDNEFFRGKVAMRVSYPNTFQMMRDDSFKENTYKQFKIKVLPMPIFESQSKMTYTTVDSHIAIADKSKNKEKAWKVLKYIMSEEFAQYLINNKQSIFNGDFVTYKSDNILNAYRTKYPEINPHFIYRGEEGPYIRENISYRNYIIYENIISKNMYNILDGILSVEDGFNLIRKQYAEQMLN